ncbi:MAG TPA: PQQ-binding-like beta-propeller repeat protein [Chthoniobacter sp.]
MHDSRAAVDGTFAAIRRAWRNFSPVALVAFLCAFLSLHLRSQSPANEPEWPRFRGPNGSGLGNAPNLPAEFSASDFNWRVQLPGIGHSSPVICGDRIFLTASPKGTTQRVAVCLSVKDGRILWTKTYDFGKDDLSSDNSYAASSAAVDSERVYFHWASPSDSALVALDQKDGHEIWNVHLGPFVTEDGPGTSPIVFGDMVILSFDQDRPPSFLLAVDARTGKERWRWEHEGSNNTPATPCLFFPPHGSPQVILATLTLGLSAVDAHNGKLMWQIPKLMRLRCVASPIVTDGGLIVAQCGEGPEDSSVEVVRPAADGRSAAKVYEVVRVGGHVPTPIAIDGRLYLWRENGYVTCLREETNEQLWSERVRGSFYGSPVCVNHRLYNMSTRGDLYVVAAADQFQQIARIPLGEGSYATPAISGGRMYLRTFTHLISVGK